MQRALTRTSLSLSPSILRIAKSSTERYAWNHIVDAGVANDLSQLVRQREVERKKAIAEGKMDDPLVPKRLEDAITMVGTCMDMCPRFERYRRERENNLDKWETVRVQSLVFCCIRGC